MFLTLLPSPILNLVTHHTFTFAQMVEAEASRLGITGPWITKSYLELILESQGGLLYIFLVYVTFLKVYSRLTIIYSDAF